MDQRQFMANWTPEQRIALTTRRDAPGLLRGAVHLGSILALGALVVMAIPGWPWLLPPLAALLVFLFAPLHESIHGTAFASAGLNRVVADLCGVLLLIPPRWFRYFHLAHHRHTQDPRHDPELAMPPPDTLGSYLWQISGLPVWWSLLRSLVTNALGRGQDAFVPAGAREAITRESRVMLALYGLAALASAIAASPLLLTVWILPLVLGQPLLRLYLMAEHGLCPGGRNMFQNTRTTTSCAPLRALAWNMPYHAEHHACPAVPFHALPRLHALARPHLKQVSPGYVDFHRHLIASLMA